MREGQRVWVFLAAVSGFLAVAFGAFAAHGLADPKAAEVMRTGSTYEMVHALATLACAALTSLPRVPRAVAQTTFLGGSLLFSGSLYALALGAPHWIGIVTPFGGMLFLTGWLVLAFSALRRPQPAS
ncbi:MAG TPA: DUF423 domain-containing protein [Caulobacteraceae bacterium]|jgi:uncharacterized membrane protein YgdD (TMEM256/DUF423 family)|nr:DUF423 domain-containing protein [Caulobacteraceae bacterium]